MTKEKINLGEKQRRRRRKRDGKGGRRPLCTTTHSPGKLKLFHLLDRSFCHRVERPSENAVTGPIPLGSTLVADFDRMEGDGECGMLSNMLDVLSAIRLAE